jgi:hypothetical protein
MLKRSLLARLLPGVAVLGVLATSLIAGPMGLFGSLAGYGYGACGYGYAYSGAPAVTGVSPNLGSTAGGTSVTITGHGFCNNLLAVNFGATPETGLPNVISDTQVIATSPAHVAGAVDVTVISGGGTSPTSSADVFTYVAGVGIFTPLNPVRALDTRTSGPKLGPGASRDVGFATHGVPANATAVAINVTATDTTAAGFFTVYPKAGTKPFVSNLNWIKGETRPNLVIVALGAGGLVTIYNALGSANAVVDLEGYWAPTGGPAGGFVALTPFRISDTRTGSGRPNAGQHLGAGGSISVSILGAGGVPASGAEGVVVNVTVTNTTAASFLTIYPRGAVRPLISNLNWGPGKTIPNRVVVRIGSSGDINIYNSHGSTDVIVDVNGYFTDATASGKQFVGVTPVRLVDTRNGTGGFTGKLHTGTVRNVQVAGRGGVPGMGTATPPTAVVLNVTATAPSTAGYFTVYPAGAALPFASDVNFLYGQSVPNLVVVKVGPSGDVNVFNRIGNVHLVVDVVGWFG